MLPSDARGTPQIQEQRVYIRCMLYICMSCQLTFQKKDPMRSPSLHAQSKMYMFQVQPDPLKHSFGMLQIAKSWSTLHRKLSNYSSMTVN